MSLKMPLSAAGTVASKLNLYDTKNRAVVEKNILLEI